MDSDMEYNGKLKVVSLFSGCGGLDLGFLLSGHYEIEFSSDINTSAAETYSENFGAEAVTYLNQSLKKRPLFFIGDIRHMDFKTLSSMYQNPDVVIGGPPCQDFSIARGTDLANAGIHTKRGRLYAYFVKALIHLKPKYFVFENVPGLVSDNKGATWSIIKDDFQNLSIHVKDIEKIVGDGFNGSNPGYELAYAGVVDASSVGVPQKRKRVIVVGVRKDLIEEASAGLYGMVVRKIKEICRENIEGTGLPFSKYPLTPIEVFEGETLDKLERRYSEIMAGWLSQNVNKKVPAMKKWAQIQEKTIKEGILKNYCVSNNVEFDSISFINAMREHESLLKRLGFYGIKVCMDHNADIACSFFHENKGVLERMFYIPPDENYKFLYRYQRFRVEGKNISMIYRRLHPLKPAYTVTANGGGGTHGYHYERSRSRLTLREMARIQSFPDSFIFIGTKAEINSQIGEAVPPLLGERISEAVWLINKILHSQVKSIDPQNI